MSTTTLGLLAVSLLVGPQQVAMHPATAAASQPIVIEHGLVSLLEEVTVPAQDAGPLLRLTVREGNLVEQGQLLGQIDDREAQAALESAHAQHAKAVETAQNDIDVRYAQAAADVATAELWAAQETNRRARNAVGAGELRKLELAKRRADLGTEHAQMQQQLAAHDRDAQAANIKAAQLSVERRKVVSPLDGLVVEIFKRPGEWVQAGEPILRVVRMNRLRVEGFLSVDSTDPHEVADHRVVVEVRLKGGGVERFSGRMVFVSPLVHAGGQYRVWAEVENRQEAGQFLLRPGHEVRMLVDPTDPADESSDEPIDAPPANMPPAESPPAGEGAPPRPGAPDFTYEPQPLSSGQRHKAG